MLLDYKREVAYICPFCSNPATRRISPFNFSGGSDVNLICPVNGCHEECAAIHRGKKRYRIDIECPLCGETHTHTITPVSFWKAPLVTYKCPESNIDIFYIGESSAVESALMQNSGIYDNLSYDAEPNTFVQSPLCEKILTIIRNLYENDCILCSCGSDRISAAIYDNKLALTCVRCHKTRYIEFTEETFKMLKNAGSIVI